MRSLPECNVHHPESVRGATILLNRLDKPKIIAGGTDLIPKLSRRQMTPAELVSLSRISSLRKITRSEEGVEIGSMVTLSELEYSDALEAFHAVKDATREVATPVIRNRATVGGNLLQDTRCNQYDKSRFWRTSVGFCKKKDGDICRVAPGSDRCWATFCSDLAPVLVVLNAQVEIVGLDRETIPLEELYQRDGINHLKLPKTRILSRIFIPVPAPKTHYRSLRIRDAIDFPELGVAVAYYENQRDPRLKIALSGMGSVVEVFAWESVPDHLETIVNQIQEEVRPMDTLQFPPLYRKKMIYPMIKEAWENVIRREE